MKKKILFGLFALALLGATGYGVNQNVKNKADLADLVLANVEALAQNEGSFGTCIYYCEMTIFYDCTLWYSGGRYEICNGYRGR